MQRWALILSTCQYTIECIYGKLNQCADCMSCLPIVSKCDSTEKILSIMEMDNLPVTASQIAKATASDCNSARSSPTWSVAIEARSNLLHYCQLLYGLTVMDAGCLLWGRRVIIPQTFQEMLLAELHFNHIGMSRMKELARSYIWWPWLNSDIEICCKCTECLMLSDNLVAVPLHPWLVPKQPWERIHIQ